MAEISWSIFLVPGVAPSGWTRWIRLKTLSTNGGERKCCVFYWAACKKSWWMAVFSFEPKRGFPFLSLVLTSRKKHMPRTSQFQKPQVVLQVCLRKCPHKASVHREYSAQILLVHQRLPHRSQRKLLVLQDSFPNTDEHIPFSSQFYFQNGELW